MKTKTNKLPPFQPVKDISLLCFLLALIFSILFTTFYFLPKGNQSHVEIQYENTKLWLKADETHSTSLSFPKSGEEKITFTNEDGKEYGFEDGFSFQQGKISITLYSDKSIQIKQEDVFCQDHTCSKLGRIYTPFTPIVCLPNHIQVCIISESFPEFDA